MKLLRDTDLGESASLTQANTRLSHYSPHSLFHFHSSGSWNAVFLCPCSLVFVHVSPCKLSVFVAVCVHCSLIRRHVILWWTEHMFLESSRETLSLCGEVTEVWAVWKWHKVTDWEEFLGSGRDALAVFLYLYVWQWVVVCITIQGFCGAKKSEHWGVSRLPVFILPSVKAPLCSPLFPPQQTSHWQLIFFAS